LNLEIEDLFRSLSWVNERMKKHGLEKSLWFFDVHEIRIWFVTLQVDGHFQNRQWLVILQPYFMLAIGSQAFLQTIICLLSLIKEKRYEAVCIITSLFIGTLHQEDWHSLANYVDLTIVCSASPSPYIITWRSFVYKKKLIIN